MLKHISLDVKAGSYVALVGSSGGGKTTLCSLIPRFYDVTKGSIRIDGKDVRDVTLKSLRENIGIVQQDVYLFAGTVYENIRYGKPGASREEIIEAAKLAKNRTTFVIAHRLSTIKNAERILVLTENGIEESGTHDELMKLGGVYAQLYKWTK